MRALLGIIVVVGVVMGGWWSVNSLLVGDQSLPVALAFGPDLEGRIELEMVAETLMVRCEGPQMDIRTGRVLWTEWVDEHFRLLDAEGQRQTLALRRSSGLIPANRIIGAPEGFLAAVLEPGLEYTLEYKPLRAERIVYRHTFLAPEEAVELHWRSFEMSELPQ